MSIKVTPVHENFVVSINQVWFPGSYTTQDAARYAAENLSDEEVEELRETKLRVPGLIQKCYEPISMKHIEEYLASKGNR